MCALTKRAVVYDGGDGEDVFATDLGKLLAMCVQLQLRAAVTQVLVLHVLWQARACEDWDAVDIRHQHNLKIGGEMILKTSQISISRI